MKYREEDLIKYILGVQFNNPLKMAWIDAIPDHLGESELRRKYKNYELPDGFTEEELKELDLFVKERVMTWFTVDELTPEEGRDILLYGKSVFNAYIMIETRQEVDDILTKGEYRNGKFECQTDSDMFYGMPFWKFIPSHWCYITKPKK